jgi:hypothetical protein
LIFDGAKSARFVWPRAGMKVQLGAKDGDSLDITFKTTVRAYELSSLDEKLDNDIVTVVYNKVSGGNEISAHVDYVHVE